MSNQKEASTGNAARQMRALADKAFRQGSGQSGKPVTIAQKFSDNRTQAQKLGRKLGGRGMLSERDLEMKSWGIDRAATASRNAAREILEKKAMDYELANAVINRYQSGQAVSEDMFFKAAHAIGADPYDALLEARFATMLSFDTEKMASGQPLDAESLALYSAAAGEDPRVLHKVAHRYGLSPESIVMRKLAEQDFIPNLPFLKMAMMAPEQDMGGGMAPEMDPMAAAGGAPAPAPGAPGAEMGPQPGASVQARYKPSPMAPMQTPPSPEGNLQELSEAARHPDAAADAQAAQQDPGGSMGPEGAPGSMGPEAGPGMDQQAAPPPPPMAPEEKIQQADPSVPPENLPRYAEKLQEIEQQTGIPMQDPGQVKKFIAQMQKDDAKVLDDAIKNMSADKPFSPSGSEENSSEDQGAEKMAGFLARAFLP